MMRSVNAGRAAAPKGSLVGRIGAALRSVPSGRVTTFEALALHAGAPVAEIITALARLNEDQRQMLPWHRVVAKGGAIGRGPWRERQFALLLQEGVPVAPAGIVQEMGHRAVTDFNDPGPDVPPLAAGATGKDGARTASPTPPSRSRGMKSRP